MSKKEDKIIEYYKDIYTSAYLKKMNNLLEKRKYYDAEKRKDI